MNGPQLDPALVAYDVLGAGIKLASPVPLLLVNEPILVSSGKNSAIRYDFYYPRWAYDAYRTQLAAQAAAANWHYLDLWNLVPEDQFTNSAIHLTPAAETTLAETIGGAAVQMKNRIGGDLPSPPTPLPERERGVLLPSPFQGEGWGVRVNLVDKYRFSSDRLSRSSPRTAFFLLFVLSPPLRLLPHLPPALHLLRPARPAIAPSATALPASSTPSPIALPRFPRKLPQTLLPRPPLPPTSPLPRFATPCRHRHRYRHP